jgi:hypothetical protein
MDRRDEHRQRAHQSNAVCGERKRAGRPVERVALGDMLSSEGRGQEKAEQGGADGDGADVAFGGEEEEPQRLRDGCHSGRTEERRPTLTERDDRSRCEHEHDEADSARRQRAVEGVQGRHGGRSEQPHPRHDLGRPEDCDRDRRCGDSGR